MKSVGGFVCLLSVALPTLARPVADPVPGVIKRDLYLRDPDQSFNPSEEPAIRDIDFCQGGDSSCNPNPVGIIPRSSDGIDFCQDDDESCNPNPGGIRRSPDGIDFCQDGDESCNPNPVGIIPRSPDGIDFCQDDDESCNPNPSGIRRSPDGIDFCQDGDESCNPNPSGMRRSPDGDLGTQEDGNPDGDNDSTSSGASDSPQKRGGRFGDVTKRGQRGGNSTR